MTRTTIGLRERIVHWYREHRRAADTSILATVVVLFAVAAGLGWTLLARSDVARSGSSPSAMPSETVSASQPETPVATLSPTAVPTASPTIVPATSQPTAEPPSAGGTIADRFAVDPPTNFISTISCEGPIGGSDPVAIVWMQPDDGQIQTGPVLRNYADVSAPRTSCIFAPGDYTIHSLVDARHLVISGNNRRYAIVDLPELRYHWFRLPTAELEAGTLFAVAPDLGSITWWRVSTEGAQGREAVLTDASGRHVLAPLPELLDGRCGSPLDSSQGAFARSGNAFYILDQLMPSVNALIAGRGTEAELVLNPPEGGWPDGAWPLMALWSPTSETLYYRAGSDVMRWSPGSAPELFLDDTPWSHPTFTPDGRYLAYATEDGVYLVNMAAGSAPELIRADASEPIFLNATQLWFKLSSYGGCVSEARPERAYDLNDRSDGPSIIDGVLAVWPATSSHSR